MIEQCRKMPEVIERVTRPAAATFAAVGDLGVLARLMGASGAHSFQPRASYAFPEHEKELRVSGGVVLVVLVNDEIARGMGGPGSRSERRNAQVVSDRPIVTARVSNSACQ